ncbi:hypothetical protein TPHA_0F01700 [Tetrapisispora phaffii CBS 4417]|uniref:Amino acid transporter transmembrane domain-containing protein n=1 Tax=Tetrapisispora phaffii (strain ATCC 24235 / CBS 4417 / NBRC 1672 / NRRL Y-8282 / UCD 70-5) TaxID=1071381 RepID=G8BV72_TETPH|nr:hypothetical protein TPHA_0F01700 [Tetrapisispora phaffii CBS 4417]CCE63654.1 hypothetical protein TPHA_0F01700 [Tetrapisispora phaffii CBS 4417]
MSTNSEKGFKNLNNNDTKQRTGTSNWKTYFLLLKSFVGTGSLLLPSAFHKGGLVFSVILIVIFGLYSYWCYFIIIKLKTKVKANTFQEIGNNILGRWMSYVILGSLVLTQIGFSSAYIIFVGENFNQVVYNMTNYECNIIYPILFQLGFNFAMSFISRMEVLTIPAVIANVLIICGIILVISYSLHHLILISDKKSDPGVMLFFNSNEWTLFIGTAIYAFEGVGLLIPIHNNMSSPKDFPKILLLVMLTMSIIFILIGTCGYLSYGEKIKVIILQSFAPGIFVNIIIVCFTIGILLSTPLQLFSLTSLLEDFLFTKKKIAVADEDLKVLEESDILCSESDTEAQGTKHINLRVYKIILRFLIVTTVCLIGYITSDKLNKLVAIVGSLACIPLVYIYPPLLNLYECSLPGIIKNNWSILPFVFDLFLIISGLCGMMYTSYRSVIL